MDIHVLNHPLVDHKLTVLRDKNTPSSTFRELVSELVMLEAYEATRDIEVVDKPIETPVAPMIGKHIAAPAPIIVPVLRAGLGMLDGMTKMIPSAEVGFLGMKRDEVFGPVIVVGLGRLGLLPTVDLGRHGHRARRGHSDACAIFVVVFWCGIHQIHRITARPRRKSRTGVPSKPRNSWQLRGHTS